MYTLVPFSPFSPFHSHYLSQIQSQYLSHSLWKQGQHLHKTNVRVFFLIFCSVFRLIDFRLFLLSSLFIDVLLVAESSITPLPSVPLSLPSSSAIVAHIMPNEAPAESSCIWCKFPVRLAAPLYCRHTCVIHNFLSFYSSAALFSCSFSGLDLFLGRVNATCERNQPERWNRVVE